MAKGSDLTGKSGSGGLGKHPAPHGKLNVQGHGAQKGAKNAAFKAPRAGQGPQTGGGKAPVARRPKV